MIKDLQFTNKNRNFFSGFTLVELIFVLVLLSVVGLIVLPILSKPFQVSRITHLYHASMNQAALFFNWFESDLNRGDQLHFIVKKHSLELVNGKKSTYYWWDLSVGELYRKTDFSGLDNIPSGDLEELKIIDGVSDILFQLNDSGLSLTLAFSNHDSRSNEDDIRFWRQFMVKGVSFE